MDCYFLSHQPSAIPDLSHLNPKTQKQCEEWIADGTFIERAIGVMLDQERLLHEAEKQEPVATFDEVWDSIDWDEWRMKSIRDVVKMIHSKTHPQHKQRYILWPVKGVRVDGDKVIIMAKGGNDAARWLCGEILFMAKDIKAQP
jgi:hypothetical protein